MCVCVSCLVMSNSLQPHRLQPTRPLYPWDYPGKNCWSGLPFTSPKGTIERKKVKWLIPVQLLATPWTVAYQAPPSMAFSRQEYRTGLPFPSSNWNIYINNYFKCKWSKCSNQKTQTGWMDTKTRPIYIYICCLQETHFRPKDTHRLKVRGWKNISPANAKQKKAEVTILISDKNRPQNKEDYKR